METFSPEELKPLKNILMFCCGLINLILSKLLNSSYFSSEIFNINLEDNKENYDGKDMDNVSIIFISELFSFFCFD